MKIKTMNDEQITHMVNRFLQWKLPNDFCPDCGIHFDADAAKKLNPNNHTYEPIGTNLLSADQAKEMVRFMIEGLPT
jgi:acetone carboxylase gamma subunit